MTKKSSANPVVVAVDLQNVAIGGDLAGTLDTTRPSRGGGQAVAIGFKQGANHSGACGGLTRECEPPITCGQDHNLVAFVKATNPHSADEAPRFEEADVAACINGWDERHDPPKHVVAFTQNTRDEVRQINGDGSIVGALSAEGGMHQTNYIAFAQNQLEEVRTNAEVMGTVNQNQNASGRNTPMVCGFSPLQGGRSMPVTLEAPTLEAGTGNKTPAIAFANRTRDGIKVPEVMKDGVVPALTNPGQGGRADAVNVASAMQVRRLTPSECEALQGFPIGYTDVPYRNKPAADGPRYRALGNSMAVPCMHWLGQRIAKSTVDP